MNRVRIDRRWLPLNALRAFEAVARHGSFTGGRHALLISQSALSRHVISIEKLIGVQLFERRPHALVLTKAGQHLLPAVTKAFDRLEYSLDEIHTSGASPLRTLRVQMPPSFAVQIAVPILRDFRHANPDIEIDLVSPYGVGPPPQDVDVAVVYSRPAISELRQRPALAGAVEHRVSSRPGREASGQGSRPLSSATTSSSMCA